MIVPDFFGNCNGKSCAGLTEESRANDVRPYGDNLVPLEKGDVPKGQGDYPSGTTCHLPFQGRQKTPLPYRASPL